MSKTMKTAEIQTELLGPAGTGSKIFINACLHSNGNIYICTYGPQPGLIWQCNPRTGELTQIAAPGEYQLRKIIEDDDGRMYIGTAYSGLIYRLDPATGKVTTVGSPPIDSTPWIFTMVRARNGKIYGSKGVGLFEFDPKTDAMRSLGLVPGDHKTPLEVSASPIVTSMQVLPDGSLIGGSNRFLFRYYIEEERFEIIADMVSFDEACYNVILSYFHPSDGTMHFAITSRFSGRNITKPLFRWDGKTNKVTPLEIEGWGDRQAISYGWVGTNAAGKKVLRQPVLHELVEIDLETQRVVCSYPVEPTCGWPIDKGGVYWLGDGGVVRLNETKKKFERVASNPTPVPTRCLAAAPDGTLGADTYDLGFMFSFDPKNRVSTSHNLVWKDDHRCNYGPAAFAEAGRYFLCNHGQGTPKLFVTDVQENRSWEIGKTASSLLACSDGSVWGVEGMSLDTADHFLPSISWTWQQQQQRGGNKVFRWRQGAEKVEIINQDFLFAGYNPLLTELDYKGRPCLLALSPYSSLSGWVLLDLASTSILHRGPLLPPTWAVASDTSKRNVYAIGEGGSLFSLTVDENGELVQERLVEDFGTAARGFFHLPGPNAILSIESDGTVNGYSLTQKEKFYARGPIPLPAGPAVDPTNNCWYFSSDVVVQYTLFV